MGFAFIFYNFIGQYIPLHDFSGTILFLCSYILFSYYPYPFKYYFGIKALTI